MYITLFVINKEWNDTRLEWASNSTYDNVLFIFSNEDYMWRPAIVIENR